MLRHHNAIKMSVIIECNFNVDMAQSGSLIVDLVSYRGSRPELKVLSNCIQVSHREVIKDYDPDDTRPRKDRLQDIKTGLKDILDHHSSLIIGSMYCKLIQSTKLKAL